MTGFQEINKKFNTKITKIFNFKNADISENEILNNILKELNADNYIESINTYNEENYDNMLKDFINNISIKKKKAYKRCINAEKNTQESLDKENTKQLSRKNTKKSIIGNRKESSGKENTEESSRENTKKLLNQYFIIKNNFSYDFDKELFNDTTFDKTYKDFFTNEINVSDARNKFQLIYNYLLDIKYIEYIAKSCLDYILQYIVNMAYIKIIKSCFISSNQTVDCTKYDKLSEPCKKAQETAKERGYITQEQIDTIMLITKNHLCNKTDRTYINAINTVLNVSISSMYLVSIVASQADEDTKDDDAIQDRNNAVSDFIGSLGDGWFQEKLSILSGGSCVIKRIKTGGGFLGYLSDIGCAIEVATTSLRLLKSFIDDGVRIFKEKYTNANIEIENKNDPLNPEDIIWENLKEFSNKFNNPDTTRRIFSNNDIVKSPEGDVNKSLRFAQRMRMAQERMNLQETFKKTTNKEEKTKLDEEEIKTINKKIETIDKAIQNEYFKQAVEARKNAIEDKSQARVMAAEAELIQLSNVGVVTSPVSEVIAEKTKSNFDTAKEEIKNAIDTEISNRNLGNPDPGNPGGGRAMFKIKGLLYKANKTAKQARRNVSKNVSRNVSRAVGAVKTTLRSMRSVKGGLKISGNNKSVKRSKQRRIKYSRKNKI